MYVTEIIDRVKEGGTHPLRPFLEDDVLNMNDRFAELVRQCWSDNPLIRPDFFEIRSEFLVIFKWKLVVAYFSSLFV